MPKEEKNRKNFERMRYPKEPLFKPFFSKYEFSISRRKGCMSFCKELAKAHDDTCIEKLTNMLNEGDETTLTKCRKLFGASGDEMKRLLDSLPGLPKNHELVKLVEYHKWPTNNAGKPFGYTAKANARDQWRYIGMANLFLRGRELSLLYDDYDFLRDCSFETIKEIVELPEDFQRRALDFSGAYTAVHGKTYEHFYKILSKEILHFCNMDDEVKICVKKGKNSSDIFTEFKGKLEFDLTMYRELPLFNETDPIFAAEISVNKGTGSSITRKNGLIKLVVNGGHEKNTYPKCTFAFIGGGFGYKSRPNDLRKLATLDETFFHGEMGMVRLVKFIRNKLSKLSPRRVDFISNASAEIMINEAYEETRKHYGY